jgi:hypothetical protein
VDSRAVEAFLQAVREPAATKIWAQACGITEQWLAKTAETSLKYFAARRDQKPNAAQATFFLEHFRRVAEAQASLDDRLKWVYLDDEPSIHVTITSGFDVMVINSGADYHFLAPWKDAKGENPNFNCRISTTLGAILPPKFLNRDRLILDDPLFISQLGEALVDLHQKEWDQLDETSDAPLKPAPH